MRYGTCIAYASGPTASQCTASRSSSSATPSAPKRRSTLSSARCAAVSSSTPRGGAAGASAAQRAPLGRHARSALASSRSASRACVAAIVRLGPVAWGEPYALYPSSNRAAVLRAPARRRQPRQAAPPRVPATRAAAARGDAFARIAAAATEVALGPRRGWRHGRRRRRRRRRRRGARSARRGAVAEKARGRRQ